MAVQRKFDFDLAGLRRAIDVARLGGKGVGQVKNLLNAIAWFSRGGTLCVPRIDVLASKMGVSRPTTKRAIRRAEKLGILHVQPRLTVGGGQRSNAYAIDQGGLDRLAGIDQGGLDAPALGVNPSLHAAPEIPPQGAPVQDDLAPVQDDLAPVQDDPPSVRRLVRHSIDPDPELAANGRDAPAATGKRRRAVVESADVRLPQGMGPLALKALERWLKYKRSRRQSYTSAEYVESMLLKFFKDYGDRAEAAFVEAVDNSIGMNYVGCFVSKEWGGNEQKLRPVIDPFGDSQ
jgi:hypothetical protein